MLDCLKSLSVPIMVTDSSNAIVYKNMAASRCFATLRLGQYVTNYIVGDNVSETMSMCFEKNCPVVLTLRLPEYECSCIVVKRTLEGSEYRFYTIIPYILEFYDADDTLLNVLTEAFSECIDKQLDYIEDGMKGMKEEASPVIKGKLRSDAKKLIVMENIMKLRLGASSGLPENKDVYYHKVNVYDDVHKLVRNFNEEYGNENLIIEQAEFGIFCNRSRSAFGRLFTYTALHCIKFSKSCVKINVTKKDSNVNIEFRIGTDYMTFPKLFDVYFSYVKRYAMAYGFDAYVEKCEKGGSRIIIKSECIDFSGDSSLRSSVVEIGVSKDFLSAILAEAESVFFLLADKMSK